MQGVDKGAMQWSKTPLSYLNILIGLSQQFHGPSAHAPRRIFVTSHKSYTQNSIAQGPVTHY